MQSDAAGMVTSATPLGLMKFEHVETAAMPLMLGTTGGSLGETSALLILACGAFLALKGFRTGAPGQHLRHRRDPVVRPGPDRRQLPRADVHAVLRAG